MPSPTYTTTVTAVRNVAPEVRELTLASPPEPLSFAPGQWLSLHLPVGERPPLVRAYSLAAPPVTGGELVLCLDRVPGGLGSEYLFTLQPGEEVTFAGPLGNFVLPEGDGELLWLARFTGIVPFRAMLLALQELERAAPVTLVYTADQEADLAYLPELRQAAERLPWFKLIPLLEQPGESPDFRGGTVLELLPEVIGDRTDLTPMVCGKRDFVRPLRDFFYGRGFERRAVKWENYD